MARPTKQRPNPMKYLLPWAATILALTTVLLLTGETTLFTAKPEFLKRRCTVSWPTLNNTAIKSQLCITTLSDAPYDSKYTRASARDFSNVLGATWENKAQYAVKHDYKLFNTSHLVDLRRPAGWSKILAIQDALRRDCEWVFWMDADSLIMNSQVRVEEILPSNENIDLVVTEDAFGYNCGMLIMRKSDWTAQFLDDWWAMTEFIRHPGDRRPGDNEAFDVLVDKTYDREQHIHIAPRCSFNSFSWNTGLHHWRKYLWNKEALVNSVYQRGDFILHFAAMNDKMSFIEEYKKQAV